MAKVSECELYSKSNEKSLKNFKQENLEHQTVVEIGYNFG